MADFSETNNARGHYPGFFKSIHQRQIVAVVLCYNYFEFSLVYTYIYNNMRHKVCTVEYICNGMESAYISTDTFGVQNILNEYVLRGRSFIANGL